MADETTKIPDEFKSEVKPKRSRKPKVEDDEETAELRSEAMDLVERKEIDCTKTKIKNASKTELERILVKYERKKAEIASDYFSDTIIQKVSDLLDFADICDGENLSKDLGNDTLFRKDLKYIISYLLPYMPFVGLACGGIIISKHWYIGKGCCWHTHPNDRIE